MDNSKKVILDLCGGTGAWSKPYKDAGYKVLLLTLPEYDISKVTFNNNGIEFIRQDVHCKETLYVLVEDIYGVLAAPPCTEFSLAKGSRPRDFKKGMEVVEACEKIIRYCQLNGKLKFWALENPRGFLRQFLGIPHLTFEQWQYGELKLKATDIWGYFNKPNPTVKEKPQNLAVGLPNGRTNGRDWAKIQCPPEYTHLNLNRAALRAITPAGFAQAFYRANK